MQGRHTIQYTDGDVEQLNLFNETWQLVEMPPAGTAAAVTLPFPPPPQAPLMPTLHQSSDQAPQRSHVAASAPLESHAAQHTSPAAAAQVLPQMPSAIAPSSASTDTHARQNRAAAAAPVLNQLPTARTVASGPCVPQYPPAAQHGNPTPSADKMPGQLADAIVAPSASSDAHAMHHRGVGPATEMPLQPAEHMGRAEAARKDGPQPGPILPGHSTEDLHQTGTGVEHGAAGDHVTFGLVREAGVPASMPPAPDTSTTPQMSLMADQLQKGSLQPGSAGQGFIGPHHGSQAHTSGMPELTCKFETWSLHAREQIAKRTGFLHLAQVTQDIYPWVDSLRSFRNIGFATKQPSEQDVAI